MLGRILVPTLVIAAVMAGCASSPDGTPDARTLAYMKIVSETPEGIQQVGWLEKSERTDPDGVRTVVDFVKDLDFDVRGHIRSEGNAVKYVDRAPLMEGAIGVKREYHELPKASREHLVRLILDLPVTAKVTFTPATVADIRK